MSNIKKSLEDVKICLELEAINESIKVLSGQVSLLAKQLEIEQKIQNQVLISIDEIFSNIVKYANLPPSSLVKVEISYFLADKILELKFIDKGSFFNPLKQAPAPDINLPIQEREIGGLGLFMVKKMMDVLEYKRDNNSNILTIKKLL